jgi:hypothetical protein
VQAPSRNRRVCVRIAHVRAKRQPHQDGRFRRLCAARLLSRRRCWGLTSFTCDRRRHREPFANALTTYDINDRSRSPTGGNDNGAPGETKHGHVSDDRAGDAVGRSSRKATEKRHMPPPADPRGPGGPSTREITGPVLRQRSTCRSTSSRSFTSFTSSTTSHIASVSPSQRPFLHMIHALRTTSHKGVKEQRTAVGTALLPSLRRSRPREAPDVPVRPDPSAVARRGCRQALWSTA